MGKLITDFIFQNLSIWNYFKGGLYDYDSVDEYILVDQIFTYRTGTYVMKKNNGVWNLFHKDKSLLYKLGDDQETPVGKWSDGEVIEYPQPNAHKDLNHAD